MKTKLAFVGLLAFSILGGCSGRGGASATPAATQSVAAQGIGGIWRGKVTNASGTVLDTLLLVSEDGRYFGNTEDPASHCAAVAQGSLTASGAALTGGGNFGEIDYTTAPADESDCSFADGSVWGTSAVTGSIVPQASMQLSSTDTTSMSTVQPVSAVAYTYDTLYNESSDLSKTAGNWTDQTGNVISFSGDGVIFSQQANTGCVLNGQASVINSLYNAYSVTVTFSDCQGSAASLNGITAIGLAALNDTVVPNELYIGYTLTTTASATYMVAAVATR